LGTQGREIVNPVARREASIAMADFISAATIVEKMVSWHVFSPSAPALQFRLSRLRREDGRGIIGIAAIRHATTCRPRALVKDANPSEDAMMVKTWFVVLACVASAASVAHAQTAGSAGGGASVSAGAGTPGGAMSMTGSPSGGIIIEGGSGATPPTSAGAGASTSQPSIGANSGGNGSVRPLGK
jgi:hypothetical protein